MVVPFSQKQGISLYWLQNLIPMQPLGEAGWRQIVIFFEKPLTNPMGNV
jgi:hypothetical protein